MVKPATPQGRRGPKRGPQAKDFAHVCPAVGCPRNGEPFKGTARAMYCSPNCNLREFRRREKEKAAG